MEFRDRAAPVLTGFLLALGAGVSAEVAGAVAEPVEVIGAVTEPAEVAAGVEVGAELT